MVIKSYFDGSNDPNSARFGNVTLASVSGDSVQWRTLESNWAEALKRHGVNYLHTTDALSLKREFSIDKGWDPKRVDLLLTELVSVLEQSCARQRQETITGRGLRPCTVRIELTDFKKAQHEIEDLPPVTEVCATQYLGHCDRWRQFCGGHWLYLFFDQGESFCGHIVDRIRNPIAKKDFPETRRILRCDQLDMRRVPGLQAADLVAWSVSHADNLRSEWQIRVLGIPRDNEFIDYPIISKPIRESIERVKEYKLPTRKKLR
jgi:hypothetical protein